MDDFLHRGDVVTVPNMFSRTGERVTGEVINVYREVYDREGAHYKWRERVNVRHQCGVASGYTVDAELVSRCDRSVRVYQGESKIMGKKLPVVGDHVKWGAYKHASSAWGVVIKIENVQATVEWRKVRNGKPQTNHHEIFDLEIIPGPPEESS